MWYDGDPTPDVNDEEPNSHGTSCAGEIAMGKNCSCGVGVAYDCSIAGKHITQSKCITLGISTSIIMCCCCCCLGLKLDFSYLTDSDEADALGHMNSYIHIYTNSWGPTDYGFSVEGPGPLLIETFSTGAREVCKYGCRSN